MPVIDLGPVVGADGAPGATGKTGATGAQGRPGQSAYELAVASGFVGTEAEWLASLRGPQGEQGLDGPAGQSAYEQAVAGGYTGTENQFKAELNELPVLVSDHSVAQYNAGDLEARQNVALGNGGVASFSTLHRFSRITGSLTFPTLKLNIDDEQGETVGELTVFPSGAQQVFIDQVRRGNENVVMFFMPNDVDYVKMPGGEGYGPSNVAVRVEISGSTISVRYQAYVTYPNEDAVLELEQLHSPQFKCFPSTIDYNLWFRTCTA